MKETDLQKYVIDVVKERGGAGQKLSNRFAIGVCDLLIKLHGTQELPRASSVTIPAMLLEVKAKQGTRDDRRAFTLDVTVLQQKFLREFGNAGMRTGVLSFLYSGGKRNLSAALFTLDELDRTSYGVDPRRHVSLGDHKVRDDNFYWLLREYANG